MNSELQELPSQLVAMTAGFVIALWLQSIFQCYGSCITAKSEKATFQLVNCLLGNQRQQLQTLLEDAAMVAVSGAVMIWARELSQRCALVARQAASTRVTRR